MSITDELREYASGWWDRKCHDHLLAIADRIDREHRMALEKVAAEVDEDAMEEHGWVKLPVDADGVPIQVGDVVMDANVREIVERVVQIRYTLATSSKAPTVLTSIITDASRLPQKPSSYRHRHAPTVEDVLREFGDWYAHVKGGCDEDGIVAEYAAKLRLAREVDE